MQITKKLFKFKFIYDMNQVYPFRKELNFLDWLPFMKSKYPSVNDIPARIKFV